MSWGDEVSPIRSALAAVKLIDQNTANLESTLEWRTTTNSNLEMLNDYFLQQYSSLRKGEKFMTEVLFFFSFNKSSSKYQVFPHKSKFSR